MPRISVLSDLGDIATDDEFPVVDVSEPVGALKTKRASPPAIAKRMHAETSGTVFPAQPGYGNNRPFFRTDLGWFCFYDGTQWLTAQEFTVTMQGGTILTWTSISANASSIYSPPLRSDYAPYFTRHSTEVQVAVPNDGSKYWTITLHTVAGNTITTVITDGIGAGGWNFFGWAINAAIAGATAVYLSFAKTSTPGDLYCSMTLYYRLIVT